MRLDKTVEKLLGQLQYKGSSAEQDEIGEPIEKAWQRHQAEQRAFSTSRASSRTVDVRWAKLTAAAAIALIGLAVSIGILDSSARPAYALEQTVEAVKDIRYFHFRLVGSKTQDVQREAWIECDHDGELKNVRVSFYPQDLEVAWNDGITQYLSLDRNELSIFRDSEYTDKILSFANRHNPRDAIDYYRRREGAGEVQIEIGELAERSEPIPVTVTYEPNTYMIGTPMPRMREVLHVDPTTRLLSQTDVCLYVKGSYHRIGMWEYLDYNQPFEPGIFDLETETDPNTTHFSTLGLDLGIGQGDMSEREIAVRVTDEFLAAWKSRDYDRAVQIHGYTTRSSRDNALKMLKKLDLLQVVELGVPLPCEPPMRSYTLACTLQIKRGDSTEKVTWDVRVRRAAAARWCIGRAWPEPPSRRPSRR